MINTDIFYSLGLIGGAVAALGCVGCALKGRRVNELVDKPETSYPRPTQTISGSVVAKLQGRLCVILQDSPKRLPQSRLQKIQRLYKRTILLFEKLAQQGIDVTEELEKVKQKQLRIERKMETSCEDFIPESVEAQYTALIQDFVEHQQERTESVLQHVNDSSLSAFETNLTSLNSFQNEGFEFHKTTCHLTALSFIEILKQNNLIQDKPDIILSWPDIKEAKKAAMIPFSVTRILINPLTTDSFKTHEFIILHLKHSALFVQSDFWRELTLQQFGGVIKGTSEDIEQLFNRNSSSLQDLFEFDAVEFKNSQPQKSLSKNFVRAMECYYLHTKENQR